MRICRCVHPFLPIAWAFALSVTVAALGQNGEKHPFFEVLTHRMDVDVDGAPNAYGPPGVQTLDILLNAHYLNRADKQIVGYLVDEHSHPTLQGPKDPFPGYYFSQTAVFSFPALVAPYAGSVVAVYDWYPNRFGAKDAFRMGNYSLLAYMGENISLEYFYSGPHSLLARMHLNNSHGSTIQGPNQ